MIETLGIKKAYLIIAASVTSLILVVTTTLLLTKSSNKPETSVTQVENSLINEQLLKPEEPNKLEKNSNEGKTIPEKVIQPEVSGTPKKETFAIGRPGALPVQGQQESNSNNNPPILTRGDTKPLLLTDGQNIRLRPRMDTPVLLRQGSSLVLPPPPLESGDSLIPPPPPEEDIDQSASEQGQQVGQSSSVVSQIPEAPPLPEKYSNQLASEQGQQESNSNNNPPTLTRNKTKVVSPENTQSNGQSGQPGIKRQRSSLVPPPPPLKSEGSTVPPPPPLKSEDSSVPPLTLEEDSNQLTLDRGQQELTSDSNLQALTRGDTKPLLPTDGQNSCLRERIGTSVLLRQGSLLIPPPPPEDISQSVQEQQIGQNSLVVSQIPEAPPLPEKYSSQSKSSTSVQDQQDSNSNNNPLTLARGNTIVIRKEVTKRRSKVAESDLSDLPTMSDDDSIKNNNDDVVSELKNSQSNDQIIGADVSNEIETKGSNNIMLNSETFLNVINQRNKGNGQSSQLGRGNSSSTLAAGDNNEDWETESDFVNNNTSNTGVGHYNVPGKSLLGHRRSSFSGFPVKCDATTYSQSNPPPLPPRQNQLLNTPPPLLPRGNKISNTSSLNRRRSSFSGLSEQEKKEQSQSQSGIFSKGLKFFQNLIQQNNDQK